MLSARKINLLAGLKVAGMDLRQAELDFYVNRYIMVGGISAVMTSLSYVGVIKIKIPPEKEPPHVRSWEVTSFYVCMACTMSLSLYTLIVSSFLVINTQGLSLRGPPGSLQKCIEILRSNWRIVRLTVVGGGACLVLSAAAIVWMKLDLEDQSFIAAPWIVSIIICFVILILIYRVIELRRLLSIPTMQLVAGDLSIEHSERQIDLIDENEREITPAR